MAISYISHAKFGFVNVIKHSLFNRFCRNNRCHHYFKGWFSSKTISLERLTQFKHLVPIHPNIWYRVVLNRALLMFSVTFCAADVAASCIKLGYTWWWPSCCLKHLCAQLNFDSCLYDICSYMLYEDLIESVWPACVSDNICASPYISLGVV